MPCIPCLSQSTSSLVPELQGTTQEVAIDKCKRAAEAVSPFLHPLINNYRPHLLQLNGPCITEDTALCFEAMNGLPGPYIKHFLAALGPAGLNTMLEGFPTKAAWALCTFAYSAGPGKSLEKGDGVKEADHVVNRL